MPSAPRSLPFAFFLSLAACRTGLASASPPPSHTTSDARVTTAAVQAPARAASPSTVTLPLASHRPPAPDLTGGIAWLNTDRPLHLSDLRGQVVVVDFWTYCCINCMHTLPILGQLEAHHRGEPVQVLGVHSAKFPGEREADRIREAIGRYDIRHPVVVDQDNAIWDRWNVQSWPSVFVIDTHGRMVGLLPGEPTIEQLDGLVNALVAEGRADGSLAGAPLAIHPPRTVDTGPLAYPGKVVSLGGDRIAFSDTGHDRIVIAHTDGTVERIVGQGIPGHDDGDLEHARFHHPQGLAAEPVAGHAAVTVLYVADTENHEIRRIDLAENAVTTLAGTGVLSRDFASAGGDATHTALRSPWDLARVGDRLIVAMAGAHQLWSLGLGGGAITPWAGSGREARVDGAGNAAAFAQPSGLALAGNTIYVADSESSSLRAVDVATRAVRTLAGEDLFVFGDVDGAATRARLQHPLGVAVIPGETGSVFVADTYNHKIRRYDVAARTVSTIAGNSSRTPFFEPSGLAWTGREFVVTDTDHHRLVRMSRDGRSVTPIVFRGLSAPVAQTVER